MIVWKTCGCVVVVAALIGMTPEGWCDDAAGSAAPNVLFLFADDLSYEAVRASGHLDIETPNLDRLAARGTTFTHAYNMGSWSGAVCVASRTMLITGRGLWSAHAVYNTTDREREAGRLWPQLLAKQGYATYFTGKWHIQAKVDQAFEVTRNVRAGMPKDVPEGYDRPRADGTDVWSPSDPRWGGYWQGGKHWTEVVADDTLVYLEQAKSHHKPFFIYSAFNAPHDPRQAPAEFVAKYPLERVAVPVNFLPEYPYHNEIGCGPGLRDEKLGPFPRTPHAVQVHRQEYFAIISHLDAQIGRILDGLEASGLADRTWIFFTADHGLAVGHHGLFGKQNMYDHSLRVPFIVVGPGVPAGARIPSPIYLQDIVPTTLELAGAPKPPQVDFHSLLPLIRGEASPAAREAIYGAYLALQRAVIHDGYKLIVYPQPRVVRLYHLNSDPQEQHDLAAEPANTATVRDLFRLLLAQQQQLGDDLDLRAAFPDL